MIQLYSQAIIGRDSMKLLRVSFFNHRTACTVFEENAQRNIMLQQKALLRVIPNLIGSLAGAHAFGKSRGTVVSGGFDLGSLTDSGLSSLSAIGSLVCKIPGQAGDDTRKVSFAVACDVTSLRLCVRQDSKCCRRWCASGSAGASPSHFCQ